jgi:PIN domain nuclease of toxin-antitoxin system
MKYLLDTHILLWAAAMPERLTAPIRSIIDDETNDCFFSAASIWEIVIKRSLGREDFTVDPHVFRRALLDNNYLEIPIYSQHTLMVSNLPSIHKDPFDKIIVAQALVEGYILLTSDSNVAQYSPSIQLMEQ